MFRLTNRLALSNLIKNRKLYYPYTLATILVIAITYIFTSLTLNSHLDDLTGADAIKMVLGLGLGIVALSSGIIVLYANSFVMKNRSKELGLYSVLGLEKRHLFSMILKETMIMGFVTLLLGIGVGYCAMESASSCKASSSKRFRGCSARGSTFAIGA